MKIRVRGIGPHQDTTVITDPNGLTVISGPSRCGKTTILTALLAGLFGTDRAGEPFNRDSIADPEAGGSVSIDGEYASLFHVDSPRKRYRQLPDGDRRSVSTEKDWIPMLPPEFRDEEITRLITVPLAWVALASTPQGGKALREVLDRAIPGATADELIAAQIDIAYPRTEKQSAARVTDLRRQVSEARGALSAINPQPPGTPMPVDAADLERARVAIAEADDAAPAAARAAVARDEWHRAVNSHRDAVRAYENWHARHAALRSPDVADVSADELQRLAADVVTEEFAERAFAADVRAYEDASRRAEAWRRSFDAAPALLSEPCPGAKTCRRVDDATAARAAYLDSIGHAAPEVPPAPVAPPAPKAKAAYDAAHAAHTAWANYRRELAILGTAPPEPGAKPPEPPPAPAPVDVRWARDLLSSVDRAEALHTASAERFQRDTERKASAVETLRAAEARLALAETHLGIIRGAPAAALRSKIDQLGEGAMQVALDEEGHVKIRVNGRPWTLASRGELIHADAWWRMSLRDAAKRPSVPVFVDDVGAVGGLELPTGPNVVHLVTTPDGVFSVTP